MACTTLYDRLICHCEANDRSGTPCIHVWIASKGVTPIHCGKCHSRRWNGQPEELESASVTIGESLTIKALQAIDRLPGYTPTQIETLRDIAAGNRSAPNAPTDDWLDTLYVHDPSDCQERGCKTCKAAMVANKGNKRPHR